MKPAPSRKGEDRSHELPSRLHHRVPSGFEIVGPEDHEGRSGILGLHASVQPFPERRIMRPAVDEFPTEGLRKESLAA